MDQTSDDIIETILRLFRERGDSEYGGEVVTQGEHALQAAHFAHCDGASSSLIVAALLHDVGHLLHDLPDDAPDQGKDDRHQQLAARWLGRWFDSEVVEPVRLHVAAKRYLCTTEPTYLQDLSEPSRVSLQLQGGFMSAEELHEFRSSKHFAEALLLRRWDDAAKVAGMSVGGLEDYVPALRAALAAGTERSDAS